MKFIRLLNAKIGVKEKNGYYQGQGSHGQFID